MSTILKVRAELVDTALGPAWQASCSCGWKGRKYWTKGAREVARAERWSHELDHEDGLA